MKLLDHDPFTGVTSYFEKDHTTGKSIIKEVQDVEPLINKNKIEAEAFDKRREWWKVGEIPLNLCYQWAVESGTKLWSKEWQEVCKKKLNDPDFRKFNVNKIKL